MRAPLHTVLAELHGFINASGVWATYQKDLALVPGPLLCCLCVSITARLFTYQGVLAIRPYQEVTGIAYSSVAAGGISEFVSKVRANTE